MKRTSSDLNTVMTSSRAGARAVRSRRSLWRKALLFILPLISLFSLVVCPATSAFAAYPTTLDPVTITTSGITTLNFALDDGVAWQNDNTVNNPTGLYTMVSYGRVQYNVSWAAAGEDITWQTSLVEGQFELNFAITNPNVTGFTFQPVAFEVMPLDHDQGIYSKTHATYINSGSSGRALVTFYKICDRPQFGSYLDFKITTTYRAVTEGANPQNLTTVHPSVTVTVGSGGASRVNWAELIDPYGKLLVDPSTGWLPTMNTNLQTMVTQQATTNSYLLTQQSQLTSIISHAAGIRQAQNTQISNQEEMIDQLDDVIDNQETQISQLQEIVDYINNTDAASVVDDANDVFIDQAAAMESGQAALEEDADDNIDAVDVAGNLAVVTTYRQSLNFWMRCVNYLPTATGSIWEAFIFGVFLAFILFILRLNK